MCSSCRFLSDEDDGVSEAVIEFAVEYVGVLKVNTQHALNVITALYTI